MPYLYLLLTIIWLLIGAIPSEYIRHDAGKILVFEIVLCIAWAWLVFRRGKIYVPSGVLVAGGILCAFVPTSLWGNGDVPIPVEFPLLLSVLLFLLASWQLVREGGWDTVFSILYYSGIVVGLVCLYEFIHFRLFGVSQTSLIPFILPPAPSARLVGPFGQSNLLAFFLGGALLVGLRSYLNLDTQRRKTSLVFDCLCVALFSYLFLQTGSKSGVIAISLSLCSLGWLLSRGKDVSFCSWPQIVKRLLIVGGLLAVALVLPELFNAGGVEGQIAHRAVSGSSGYSVEARLIFWMTALLIFKENIFFGAGLGQYKLQMSGLGAHARDLLDFVSYHNVVTTEWAHNDLLQILAEGGVAAGLAILFFCVYLIRCSRCFLKDKPIIGAYIVSIVIFFVLLSFFSYPLHNFTLLCVFSLTLSVMMLGGSEFEVHLNTSTKMFASILLVFWLGLISWHGLKEYRVGAFKYDIVHGAPVSKTFPAFVELVDDGYAEHLVLDKVLPIYVDIAIGEASAPFARRLIPFAARLVEMDGSGGQWYNLALLRAQVGEMSGARKAINRALELKPMETRFWAMLHFLDMKKAAEDTGRPIEEFYPHGQEYRLDRLGG